MVSSGYAVGINLSVAINVGRRLNSVGINLSFSKPFRISIDVPTHVIGPLRGPVSLHLYRRFRYATPAVMHIEPLCGS
jgi:hypothetical protein